MLMLYLRSGMAAVLRMCMFSQAVEGMSLTCVAKNLDSLQMRTTVSKTKAPCCILLQPHDSVYSQQVLHEA